MVVDAHLVNLFGAAAIAISDRIHTAVESTVGQTASFAAALILVDRYPQITVEVLGQYLQLSQSGAARLVERLVGQHLVERQRGRDRRFVQLYLTAKGRETVQSMQQARIEAISTFLRLLTAEEQDQLLSLFTKLAVQQSESLLEEGEHICRFCNAGACSLSECQSRIQRWHA